MESVLFCVSNEPSGNACISIWRMPRHLADYENDGFEKQLRECRCYTVEELFCCGYTRYFWEANKIRYPEYVGFAAIKTDYNNTDLSDTDLINLSGGKIR